MNNYSVIFQLKRQPSYEIFYLKKPRPKVFIGLPGLIALDLANTQLEKNKEKGIFKFEEKYGLINDEDKQQSLLKGLMSYKNLNDERTAMNDFIKMVFLTSPEIHPEFEDLSNDERINAFIGIKGQGEDIASRFSELSIKPHFNVEYKTEPEYKAEPIKIFEKINHYNISTDTIEINPDGMSKKQLDTYKNHTKQLPFTWEYEGNNIIIFAWLELLLMADSGLKIKSCHKCSAYFSPYPPNTLHCPECREIYTAQALYRERVKEKIEELTEEEKEKLLKKEREEKARYMREYRKKKKQEKEGAMIRLKKPD